MVRECARMYDKGRKERAKQTKGKNRFTLWSVCTIVDPGRCTYPPPSPPPRGPA